MTKILVKQIILSWERHIEYRWAALAWIINGFIVPAILTMIWLTIRESQGLPLDDSQIITYYFLSAIVFRISQTWVAERLGWQIKDGILSKYLIQPVPYWLPQLGTDIGLKGVRLVSLLPFLLLFIAIFYRQITLAADIYLWGLVLVALIIGYMINFILNNIIGLMALWVEHVYGVYSIYLTVEGLLSGSTIPLIFMPAGLAALMVWLPFRYIIGFPIELAMGLLTVNQIFQGFLIMTGWLIGFYFLWQAVYKVGIKKYSAVGN